MTGINTNRDWANRGYCLLKGSFILGLDLLDSLKGRANVVLLELAISRATKVGIGLFRINAALLDDKVDGNS